ncbi:MAG TPA: TOBE domain-containing protein, partial [Candidatus Polarisedimenticolia bacterium]|nr:TOBE domain-containing protein [Candidatus Polarisedimenticolia bacterium]
LPAVIADAVPAGGVALLRFDEPERFHVAVTADAREDLDLRPGRSVFLLIKSTSLRPVELRRA